MILTLLAKRKFSMKIVMAHFRDISGVSGGLERVLCNFSNEMSKRGHDVHILTYDTSETGIPYFPLEKNVKVGVRIFFWTILVVLTLSLSFLCILLDSCRPR